VLVGELNGIETITGARALFALRIKAGIYTMNGKINDYQTYGDVCNTTGIGSRIKLMD
jgi:hypothetical protein